MQLKVMKKGEVLYNEGEIPELFCIVKEGILNVEKKIHITYSNYWP